MSAGAASEGTGYFGKFRGVVTDNQDPLMLGRLRARVADQSGSREIGWATPCAPFGGNKSGFFAVPPKDAGVWIEFENGDPDLPIWSGCWWGSATEMPPTLLTPPPPSHKVMLRTPAGHTVLLDDTPGTGGITLETATGQKIAMTAKGIEISSGTGATVVLKGPQVSINNGALDVT
jgi:uncharacterized protein involved in type VI secretion and phage assembly